MKIKINFKGKKIELDVKEMRGMNKMLGLMVFRKDALFFDFGNFKRMAIHSIFCPRFLAIWLDKSNKVVEFKFIKNWHFSIKPKKDFSKLIEIPVADSYKKILRMFSINF